MVAAVLNILRIGENGNASKAGFQLIPLAMVREKVVRFSRT